MSHNAQLLPPREELLERYDYNPDDGSFRSKKTGELILREDPSGYRIVTIQNKTRRINRVIWKIMTGEDADGVVEYIDKDPTNNRWDNFRVVSEQEFIINKMEHDMDQNLDSEYNGVSFFKRTKTWRVQLRIAGFKYAKYGFKSETDAIEHSKVKRREIIEQYRNKDSILAEKKERVEIMNDLFDGDISV